MMGRNTLFCRPAVTGLFIAAALLVSLQSATAADPDLTRLSPYGAQRGQEVEVTFSGDRLEDAVEVISYEPGLEITDVVAPEDKKGKTVTAKIKVKEDSPLGAHRLRIRTKTGLTKIASFFVGNFPVVDEKEPNTDFSTPNPIQLNQTVHGRIDNEDVDYFVVPAKKGQRLTAEVEGLRMGTYFLGANFFDPYVAILNEARFELAACDDHALTYQDGFASVIVPEDGNYIIEVRDASYGGHSASLYRLHVGDYVRPTATVPAGGQPGETVNVTFYGDVTGPFQQQITLPTEKQLDFGIFAGQGAAMSPTPNRFWLSSLPNIIEKEPNEDRNQATEISIPSAANGIVLSDEDTDYFKMTMKKDQEVDIDVIARRVRSAIDSVIDVYDEKGRRLAGDDDRKRPDSWVRFKAPADGNYFFRVRDQLNNGGADFHYRVEVTPVSPAMEITTNEEQRYVQPDVELPQGSRTAMLLSVKRENFGGAVQFIAENLPAGVRIESPENWASSGVVPLMFHAEENVELGNQFARIIGQWTHPSNKDLVVTAPVEQHHMKIRGRNQNDYVWAERLDAIPVVTTEKVPFDIQIVQPKVPLVRGGQMQLKVVATRAEGFDEEIRVQVLQNPPGVNSSRSVKIEKGQTEALIPMNASGNAPIQESAITVTGTARVGNGNISINTPFAMLNVAEKYMNLEFVSAATEQGAPVDLQVKVTNLTPFADKATVKLVGLPAKTSTVEKEITKDDAEIVFPITTDPASPVGETKNLFCQITVIENGEPIVHNIGSGRLRINKPAPVVVAKPKTEEKPVEKKPETPKPKVLSRLEQLRLQQEQIRAQAN